MITGTNGLLRAADGAFIMHKKKRTDNLAEMELWKQLPNPLMEAINNFLTEDKPEWEGTQRNLQVS